MMGLAATSFGASTLSPRSVHDMAKSIFALPTGNMAASQEQQMPSSASSFMDSVATFTEGFALTHSEPEAMSDWAMGGKADLHASVFAQDAFEIIQLESAVHSDLSADISDQSWKIPAEMLITDTDDFVL